MIEYPQITHISENYLRTKIQSYLKEDNVEFDLTTNWLVTTKKISATIEAENDIIFVGRDVINMMCKDDVIDAMFKIDTMFKDIEETEVKIFFNDGDKVKSGEVIASIEGPANKILKLERVLLNIIQRLSGIATTTKQYASIAEKYNVKILDTRKTTPGMRLFEKYAVVKGGGYNHRYSLAKSILIKDNHIQAVGGIEQAVKKIKEIIKKSKKTKKRIVELEVDTIEQLKIGLEAELNAFLLDNMPPEKVIECVDLVRSTKDGYDIFLEASGSITLNNLEEYCKTGINAISIGALTHRIVSANIHIVFHDIDKKDDIIVPAKLENIDLDIYKEVLC